MGSMTWLCTLVFCTEGLICIKFGRGMFPNPTPPEVLFILSNDVITTQALLTSFLLGRYSGHGCSFWCAAQLLQLFTSTERKTNNLAPLLHLREKERREKRRTQPRLGVVKRRINLLDTGSVLNKEKRKKEKIQDF